MSEGNYRNRNPLQPGRATVFLIFKRARFDRFIYAERRHITAGTETDEDGVVLTLLIVVFRKLCSQPSCLATNYGILARVKILPPSVNLDSDRVLFQRMSVTFQSHFYCETEKSR